MVGNLKVGFLLVVVSYSWVGNIVVDLVGLLLVELLLIELLLLAELLLVKLDCCVVLLVVVGCQWAIVAELLM